MRPAKRFRVFDLRGVAVVDVVANDDAADWNVFLQRPGNADEHLRMEASKFLMRFAGNEACVGVPLKCDGMNDKPVSRGIREAAVLIKPTLVADQPLWISKVSLHRTALVHDGRDDECAPGVGAELFFHVDWSAVGH